MPTCPKGNLGPSKKVLRPTMSLATVSVHENVASDMSEELKPAGESIRTDNEIGETESLQQVLLRLKRPVIAALTLRNRLSNQIDYLERMRMEGVPGTETVAFDREVERLRTDRAKADRGLEALQVEIRAAASTGRGSSHTQRGDRVIADLLISGGLKSGQGESDGSTGLKSGGRLAKREYDEHWIASLPEPLRGDAQELLELRERAIEVICRRNRLANMALALKKQTQPLNASNLLELEDLECSVGAFNLEVDLMKSKVSTSELALQRRLRERRLEGVPTARLAAARSLLDEEQKAIDAAVASADPSISAARTAQEYSSGVEHAWRMAVEAGDQVLADAQLIRLEQAVANKEAAHAVGEEQRRRVQSIRADFAARLEAMKER